MECRDFQKLIPKIIDDDIPEEDLEKVLEHVKSCKDCYDEMEIFTDIQRPPACKKPVARFDRVIRRYPSSAAARQR